MALADEFEEANTHIDKALSKLYPAAINTRARQHYYGICSELNYDLSLQLNLYAFREQFGQASADLSIQFFHGKGVKQDLDQALVFAIDAFLKNIDIGKIFALVIHGTNDGNHESEKSIFSYHVARKVLSDSANTGEFTDFENSIKQYSRPFNIEMQHFAHIPLKRPHMGFCIRDIFLDVGSACLRRSELRLLSA